jgi:hypothetical protein
MRSIHYVKPSDLELAVRVIGEEDADLSFEEAARRAAAHLDEADPLSQLPRWQTFATPVGSVTVREGVSYDPVQPGAGIAEHDQRLISAYPEPGKVPEAQIFPLNVLNIQE